MIPTISHAPDAELHSTFGSTSDSRARGPRFDTPVWPHTFVSPSADSRRAVVSYWRKKVHKVLVNRLGGIGQPWKSVVRLTDRPHKTIDVYHGRKATAQHAPDKSFTLH